MLSDFVDIVAGLCGENPPPGFSKKSTMADLCPRHCQTVCRPQDRAKLAALSAKASLADRESIVSLIVAAISPCISCILQTVAFVCGDECIRNMLHLSTGEEVQASACFPELADRLIADQGARFSEAVVSRHPIGLSSATKAVNDLYLPSATALNGQPVYQGIDTNLTMHRCVDGSWAITTSKQPSLSSCTGLLAFPVDPPATHRRSGNSSRAEQPNVNFWP